MEEYESWLYDLSNLSEEMGFAVLAAVREEAARLLGTSPDRLAFMPNTSYGLNAALHGLDWRSGDELIYPALEFPAIPAVVRHLSKRRGIRLREVRTDKDFLSAETLAEAVTPATRVVAASWVQFFNGYRIDTQPIVEACRENDALFVVDGIQGLGALSIDVETAGLDVFAAAGHKWLLSPQGTGILYISERASELIDPPWLGWLSMEVPETFESLIGLPYRPAAETRVFETGSYPFQLVAAFARMLAELNRHGAMEIEQRIRMLVSILTDYLADRGAGKYRLLSDFPGKNSSGIVSFTCSGPGALHDRLLSARIVTSLRESAIRVSPHFYNSPSEMARLLEVLESFV